MNRTKAKAADSLSGRMPLPAVRAAARVLLVTEDGGKIWPVRSCLRSVFPNTLRLVSGSASATAAHTLFAIRLVCAPSTGGQRIYFPAPSTTANIYARVMEAADKKNTDILADVFLKVPILLCVPAPAGGGNSKKNFELGNTKSNWES